MGLHVTIKTAGRCSETLNHGEIPERTAYHEAMRPLTEDTHPEAEQVQIEIWRSWTPEKRIACAASLMVTVRQTVEQAIRAQHPEFSEAERRIEFLRRAYGEEIANRVQQHLALLRDV